MALALTRTQRAILRSAYEHPQHNVVAYAPTGPLLRQRFLLDHERGNIYSLTPLGIQIVQNMLRNELLTRKPPERCPGCDHPVLRCDCGWGAKRNDGR